MNQFLTFAFIGGDLRQIRAISRFAADGHTIHALGFDGYDFSGYDQIHSCKNLDECLGNADIVVLPVPYNNSTETVNASFSATPIYINDVLRKMSGNQLLFAGKADDRLKALANLYNVHLIDYLEREEMSVLNSIPTVEGALEIAIAETPYTIHGSNCLVLGFGRIGKLLSATLKSMGANTYVAARKCSDLAWIKAYGYTGIPFKNTEDTIGNYDIIFNTIPSPVLDFKLLSKISDNCLIIDLASRPGGVDFEIARKLGKKVIWALSLPGKIAPNTAGDIMKDTIVNILEELGV